MKKTLNAEAVKDVRPLDTEEAREIAEIMRALPEDYRKTLHGAAIGLKMAADLDTKPTPPASPAAARAV